VYSVAPFRLTRTFLGATPCWCRGSVYRSCSQGRGRARDPLPALADPAGALLAVGVVGPRPLSAVLAAAPSLPHRRHRGGCGPRDLAGGSAPPRARAPQPL